MSLCACGDVGVYKCPQCELPYCSLSCYKGPAHTQCSESFYKQQVEEELRERSVTKEEQDRMLQVLQREHTHSSDEEDEVDLKELLRGMEIKSEEELWGMLTEQEQQGFIKSIKTGSITTLLKPKEFWWTKDSVVYKPTKTAKFEDLCSREPSVHMKFHLLHVIMSYVHVELIHPLRTDLVPEYWAVFTQLWSWKSPNVFITAEAACIAHTDIANSAGLQDFVPLSGVFENTCKLLKHGPLAVERVCCELIRILTKVHKTTPLEKGEYTKIKKKLQFYSSWSLSKHSSSLAVLALELEVYITKLNSDTRKFTADLDSGCRAEKITRPLIEELES